MLKKYQSKSSISLSVLMGTGKSVHVSFDSVTGGGSVFYTEDEELQAALAKHPKFGRLFKEVAVATVTTAKPAVKATVKVEQPAAEEEVEDEVEDNDETTEEAENEATEEEASNLKQIHVTDLEDAKNYLADNYGVSRTKIRSKKAIVEVAEANGIEFVGI